MSLAAYTSETNEALRHNKACQVNGCILQNIYAYCTSSILIHIHEFSMNLLIIVNAGSDHDL